MDNRAKVKAFEELIIQNGPWSLWATITFRRPVDSSEAIKRFKTFMRNLNTRDEILIHNFAWCFVLLDRGSGREGVHIHALIRGIHPLNAMKLEKKCEKHFGISKVVPYVPSIQPNATLYLAQKYALSTLADFSFMKIDSRIRVKSMMPRTRIQL